ncbi:MAG: NAD(P)/FAD-dependent oxidoreductase, partial [Amylibacter sp.]|nr:NAD(P)/FAD-dependent oxidoreductase [Amylibacter sp.]
DVCIVGAGAAGLMCAIEAGRRGRSVLLLDHSNKPAEKIRISGGGRCNFTNLGIQADRFLSQNPHFAKSALSSFTQYDFIDMVASYNIPYHEKMLGQLFCNSSAKDIIDMLLTEARSACVEIRMNTALSSVKKKDNFTLTIPTGKITSDALVIATGGKSIPKMGATGWGYLIAKQFGIPLVETRPALVPLTFADQDLAQTKPLAGVSVEANVRNGFASFDEGLLFTHRGLSGPSILQISSYWREGQEIIVNLATRNDTFKLLKDQRHTIGRSSLIKTLSQLLPARLAEVVVQEVGLTGNLADQSDKALQILHDRVHNWQIKPCGSEGYRTAEVTLGGVDTNAINAKTMMAKSVPGLFFIGEVMDVTGWLGGYNFQWAWSSGWAAGQAV